MIIEEDAVEAFLEHHGVKGQKWGIRNTGRTISRKAKKAAGFISKHKEVIGTIAAGAAFAGTILADKQLRANHPTKAISIGKGWVSSPESTHAFSANHLEEIRRQAFLIGRGTSSQL